MRELADGLGYWAAEYQTLPTDPAPRGALRAREAIAAVPVVPEAQRVFTGTIVSSLVALADFPAFAPVFGMLAVEDAPGTVLSDLTETFARVFLANTHDVLTAIVFIHAVTSAAALRTLLPYLPDETAREAVRYAWQTGCALYAAFGQTPPSTGGDRSTGQFHQTLVDRAIANGDEHAIKFAEACLRENDLNPSGAYLAAANLAIDTLRPG